MHVCDHKWLCHFLTQYCKVDSLLAVVIRLLSGANFILWSVLMIIDVYSLHGSFKGLSGRGTLLITKLEVMGILIQPINMMYLDIRTLMIHITIETEVLTALQQAMGMGAGTLLAAPMGDTICTLQVLSPLTLPITTSMYLCLCYRYIRPRLHVIQMLIIKNLGPRLKF